MRRRLLQAGITVVDWHVDQSLDQAIYAAMGRVPLWTRAAGLEVTYDPKGPMVRGLYTGRRDLDHAPAVHGPTR